MSDLDVMTADDVVTVDDLIDYVRSKFGVVVTWKTKAQFKNQLKQFLKDNPHVDLSVIVKTTDWAKAGRKKVTTLAGIFYCVDFARRAGALPELDPKFAVNEQLEEKITEALSVETDEKWRHRLIASSGAARMLAIEEWTEKRGMAIAS